MYNIAAWNQVRPVTTLGKTRRKLIIPAFTALSAQSDNHAVDVKGPTYPDQYLTGEMSELGINMMETTIQIDFWIKPGAIVTGSQETCYAFSRGFNSSSTNVDFQIKILKTGVVVFLSRTAGGLTTTTSTAKVVRNEWNHIGIQWSGNEVTEIHRIYVNGVKYETSTASIYDGLNHVSDDFYIGNVGAAGGDTNSAPFQLDELRIWVLHQPDSYFNGLIPNFKRDIDELDFAHYWNFNDHAKDLIASETFSAGSATRNADGYPNILSARSFIVANLHLLDVGKDFSLKFPVKLGTTDYSLTVSWTSNEVFYRRLLHRGQDLQTYIQIADYAGETIDYLTGKIEIWNDMFAASVSGVETILETSILQEVTDLNGTPEANSITLDINTGLWNTLPTFPMSFTSVNQDIL